MCDVVTGRLANWNMTSSRHVGKTRRARWFVRWTNQGVELLKAPNVQQHCKELRYLRQNLHANASRNVERRTTSSLSTIRFTVVSYQCPSRWQGLLSVSFIAVPFYSLLLRHHQSKKAIYSYIRGPANTEHDLS